MNRFLGIPVGYYVEDPTTGRWGRVVEQIWGDHGMLGSNLTGYNVELPSGEVVEFNWLDTETLSPLEVMARL